MRSCYKVLTLDSSHPGLKCHDERAFELVLRPVEFGNSNTAAHRPCERVKLLGNDIGNRACKVGVHCCLDSEQTCDELERADLVNHKRTRVYVAVVEARTVVNRVVAVQHVGVQTSVHAFPWPAWNHQRTTRGKLHAPAEKLPPPPSNICNVANAYLTLSA